MTCPQTPEERGVAHSAARAVQPSRRASARTHRWRAALATALAGAALAAAACNPVYYPPGYWEAQDGVAEAPPEPRTADPGPPPSPEHVWTPGYWYWGGATYVWVNGHWATPPVTGHVWVRTGWVVHNGRYHYVRGYWAPPTHRVQVQYVHPRRRGPVYRQRVRVR